jgi:hypothetical protein
MLLLVKVIVWFRVVNASIITLAQAFSGQNRKTKHLMVKVDFMIVMDLRSRNKII